MFRATSSLDDRWAEWSSEGKWKVSDPGDLKAWVAEQDGRPILWSPTGPELKVPPRSEAEALAVALSWMGARSPDTSVSVEGDPPEISSLWLDPGEDDSDYRY